MNEVIYGSKSHLKTLTVDLYAT